MTPDQFKQALKEQGFTVGPSPRPDRGCDWYAHRKIDGEQCEHNHRPPSLLIWPFALTIDGQVWHSTEFEVTGQINDADWITSRVYGVPMHQAIERLPRIERTLTCAWNAAKKA